MNQWDVLITEKLDAAVKATTIGNVFPLIAFYNEVIATSARLKRDSKDTQLIEQLSCKLAEKGFPTDDEWVRQTVIRHSSRRNPPLCDPEWGAIERAEDPCLDDKYAQMGYKEQLGIDIAVQIQFLLRPERGNNNKYLNLLIDHYKQIKATPQLIQEGQKWVKRERGYTHALA